MVKGGETVHDETKRCLYRKMAHKEHIYLARVRPLIENYTHGYWQEAFVWCWNEAYSGCLSNCG